MFLRASVDAETAVDPYHSSSKTHSIINDDAQEYFKTDTVLNTNLYQLFGWKHQSER